MVMDRLQKKCFAASAGLHLLLGTILVFGPAFITPERTGRRPGQIPNQEEIPFGQVFTLLPEPVAAPPSQPQAPPQQLVRANTQPQPDGAAKVTKGRVLPTPEMNPATRDSKLSGSRNASRDRRLEQFNAIVKDIHKGTSPATKIEMGINVSGGDDAYAQYVREAYTGSWDLSGASTAGESVTIRVTVTIANDGKVLSSRVIAFSGDFEVDKTVARTLERVTSIRPFGEGASDTQRTYTINFRCNAKGN
jgi:TonB family protein